VKPEQNPDETPTLEIFESVVEVPSLEQLDATSDVTRNRWLARRLRPLAEGRTNNPYWAALELCVDEHFVRRPSTGPVTRTTDPFGKG
jgi:hypothetical protein